MQKIRKGDDVVVITGKWKGQRGTVLTVDESKIIVEGVNLVKKHMKPNPMTGVQGGIIERELPMQRSNVAIFNPATGKADRVGVKFLEDGKKVRIFKSTKEVIDV